MGNPIGFRRQMSFARVLYLVFLVSLPLYFNNRLGIYAPVLVLVAGLPFWISKINRKEVLLLCTYVATLTCIQVALVRRDGFNDWVFITKLGAILLFGLSFCVAKAWHNEISDRFVNLSFCVSTIYAIYAAFSYMLGYSDFLVPGTGGPNNLSPYGHLRCGTFGEGNYYGGFLAFLALFFYARKKPLRLVAIMSCVALSPIPMILIGYLYLKRFYTGATRLNRRLLLMFGVFLVVGICICMIAFTPKVEDMGDASSPLERFEFVRAGLAMWFDHPFFGVGMGQFGEILGQYSILPHILQRISNEGYRYIANNNLAEVISEQGLMGLVFYAYIVHKFTKFCIDDLKPWEKFLYIFSLGMTMPTLFQVVVGAFLGILSQHPESRTTG